MLSKVLVGRGPPPQGCPLPLPPTLCAPSPGQPWRSALPCPAPGEQSRRDGFSRSPLSPGVCPKGPPTVTALGIPQAHAWGPHVGRMQDEESGPLNLHILATVVTWGGFEYGVLDTEEGDGDLAVIIVSPSIRVTQLSRRSPEPDGPPFPAAPCARTV